MQRLVTQNGTRLRRSLSRLHRKVSHRSSASNFRSFPTFGKTFRCPFSANDSFLFDGFVYDRSVAHSREMLDTDVAVGTVGRPCLHAYMLGQSLRREFVTRTAGPRGSVFVSSP